MTSAQDEPTTPERSADAPAPLASPKRIAVFSDGTGNSSRALFRTNVYRLYDALDLGAGSGGSGAGNPTQIAYYDDGVGTSSFRFLAMLGGILGLGLKRNLLDLYLYVCRNYNDSYPGTTERDTIYAFGFSRGAFTIRLLVALICTQGIVPYKDERELQRNCADAVRRFLGQNSPDLFPWLFQFVRWLRDRAIAGWRHLRGQDFDRAGAVFPDIEFVGVWDTVAAYGGPIVEITRGIDQYVWPLTMTDYELHPKVKAARHALALDDERDSFWPLLWDEIAELRGRRKAPLDGWTAEQSARAGQRLKQVWFAGMHSDVGGGYPDDSLAYVSLKWMIDELNSLGPRRLALIPTEEQRIRAFANPLGPMHDSRSGFGAYYRYQPRKIAALLHRSIADTVGMNQTRVLRDPIIGEKGQRPQGLLASCTIHRSVIERIAVGNDNYAPIGLPRTFVVEPPFAAGDPSPLAAAVRNLETRDNAKARGEIQENAWDNVWMRRVCYFAVILLSVLLGLAPLLSADQNFSPGMDSRWIVDDLFVWGENFVPGMARPWYDAWTANWLAVLIIVGALWLMMNAMSALEADLRDRMRIAWWDAVEGKPLEKFEPTALRALRNSLGYQAIMQFWKWRVLPFLFGVGILLLVPWLTFAIWTQVGLVGMERGTTFCKEPERTATSARLVDDSSAPLAFDPKLPCAPILAGAPTSATAPIGKATRKSDVRAAVTQGERYYVVVDWAAGERPWRDGSFAVPARGLPSFDFPFPQSLAFAAGSPFKRVVLARWLEPLVEVRQIVPRHTIRGYRRRIDILRLAALTPPSKKASTPGVEPPPVTRWIASFTAPIDGTASFFLNDAALPASLADPSYFYASHALAKDAQPATVTLWNAAQFDAFAASCNVDKWNRADMALCAAKETKRQEDKENPTSQAAP